MAFNNSASRNSIPESDRAKGFLNLYIPRFNADGSVGQYKIDGIALRESNPEEKALIEWLQKDPANVQKLLSKMTANFQLVNHAGRGKLALD